MNYFQYNAKQSTRTAREPRNEREAHTAMLRTFVNACSDDYVSRADLEARRIEGARIHRRGMANEMEFNVYPRRAVHALSFRAGYRGNNPTK